jgi:hypothetical protein
MLHSMSNLHLALCRMRELGRNEIRNAAGNDTLAFSV